MLFCLHRTQDEVEINSSANEYSNETFEPTEATQGQTSISKRSYGTASGPPPSSSRPSRLSKLAKEKGLELPARSTKAPVSPSNNTRKGSESESEDSFSLTFSGNLTCLGLFFFLFF